MPKNQCRECGNWYDDKAKLSHTCKQSTDFWKKAQDWELNWWKNVFQNTLNEELKQLVYAEKMGLRFAPDAHSPFWIDFENKTVLDIGCGASSILLKGKNMKEAYAIDPLLYQYPQWVIDRYRHYGITAYPFKGEQINYADIDQPYSQVDLVLIYNVLQHTQDPEKIIANARKIAREVRIFEWVGHKTNDGHPHELTKENLDKWLGGDGKVEYVNKNNAVGTAYFGIFQG